MYSVWTHLVRYGELTHEGDAEDIDSAKKLANDSRLKYSPYEYWYSTIRDDDGNGFNSYDNCQTWEAE